MKTEPVTVGYERTQSFNPASSKQVAALIRHCGLKMPMKRGENRETTESKYLRRFAKKHEVFKWVLECRERGKMLSSYMWQLDAGERVHTTFGFHPSTWRKSSRNPNLQTIPKRNADLAEGFRRMIVAAPGHVFIEADASGIEAVLVGYSAGSERYVKLAKAGVHGWLTSQIVGDPIDYQLPFEALKARCSTIKKANKVAYEAAKRVTHGSNYLLSAFGIYDEYAEFFPEGRKQAQQLQELYFSLPPGQDVRKWQQQTMERAHKEHYLDNHWGYRHYFYDVFTWDRKREQYALGSDAKRAVAFTPQSDASAIQTETMLRFLQYEGLIDMLRLIVHDSFILEAPENCVDKVCRIVYDEMTAPLDELGGLSIGAEVKVGPNLAEMCLWTPTPELGIGSTTADQLKSARSVESPPTGLRV